MSQEFTAGDVLLFQVEAGFGLLRLLAIDGEGDESVWHLLAYADMFPDPETADSAASNPDSLKVSIPHMALTKRAFESTQTARMSNAELSSENLESLRKWRESKDSEISDRSVRLLLGLR